MKNFMSVCLAAGLLATTLVGCAETKKAEVEKKVTTPGGQTTTTTTVEEEKTGDHKTGS